MVAGCPPLAQNTSYIVAQIAEPFWLLSADMLRNAARKAPGLKRTYATPASRIGMLAHLCIEAKWLKCSKGDTKVAMSAFEPNSYINYQVGDQPSLL